MEIPPVLSGQSATHALHRPRGWLPEFLAVSAAAGVLTLVLSRVISDWEALPWASCLGVLSVLVVRSALVPSSARRALLAGTLASGVVLVVLHGTWQSALGFEPALPRDARLVSLLLAAIVLTVAVARREQRRRNLLEGTGYRVGRRIGGGGAAEVFRGEQLGSGLRVALGLVRTLPSTAKARQRLEQAFSAARRLDHPSIVQLFDYGQTETGQPYFAAELIDGLPLSRIVESRGPMPPARAIHLLRQASLALSEAHDRGILHGDVAPSNLMVRRAGYDWLVIIDWTLAAAFGGLAKGSEAGMTVGAQGTPAAAAMDLALRSQSEFSGGPLRGTPAYLAPEVITEPEGLDQRADLYGLAATAYYLLSGQHPFPEATLSQVVAAKLAKIPVPPSARLGRKLPSDLEQLIMDCLAIRRERRPADLHEFERRLAACRDADAWTLSDATSWWACEDAPPAVPPSDEPLNPVEIRVISRAAQPRP